MLPSSPWWLARGSSDKIPVQTTTAASTGRRYFPAAMLADHNLRDSSGDSIQNNYADQVGKGCARRIQNCAGFALIESVMGVVLVSVMLSCVFAMNSQILSLLKQGKESTYATQMIQERVEQLRTSLWDEVTDPAKLTNVALPATANAVNLPGAIETIKVEPVVNPSKVSVTCVRQSSGTVSTTGAALTTETSVKVTVSVHWPSRGRLRDRGISTVLSKDGI